MRAQTLNALGRLSVKRGPLKHISSSDSYHISHEYEKEMSSRTAQYLLGEQAVKDDLRAGIFGLDPYLDDNPDLTLSEVENLHIALGRTIQNCGESFHAAITSGELEELSLSKLTSEIAKAGYGGTLAPDQAAQAVLEVLKGPSPACREHLSQLFDAYTLLAFLRATPDVQHALSKVFSDAQIWLDTSAILPVLAETLVDNREDQHFTLLLEAATSSGIELYFTDGVIEEILSHLRRCENMSQLTSPQSTILPYIYGKYVLSGRDPKDFPLWLEEFRGARTSEQDLREYLEYHFNLTRGNLLKYAEAASEELRGAVQELWYGVHERRRSKSGSSIDPATVSRLVAHDVENTVGVIQLRRESPDLPLGHKAWWLTLDRTALRLSTHLRDQLGEAAPDSPALNPDFLAQLLRLRPRPTHDSPNRSELPTTLSDIHDIPTELLTLAKETRDKFRTMDELRIRREVRTAILDARSNLAKSPSAGKAGDDDFHDEDF